jgi:hypothetical protein
MTPTYVAQPACVRLPHAYIPAPIVQCESHPGRPTLEDCGRVVVDECGNAVGYIIDFRALGIEPEKEEERHGNGNASPL